MFQIFDKYIKLLNFFFRMQYNNSKLNIEFTKLENGYLNIQWSITSFIKKGFEHSISFQVSKRELREWIDKLESNKVVYQRFKFARLLFVYNKKSFGFISLSKSDYYDQYESLTCKLESKISISNMDQFKEIILKPFIVLLKEQKPFGKKSS